MPQVITIPYKPFDRQREFHDSTARIRGLISGIGGGKTKAGANEMVRKTLENKGSYGVCIAPTYQMLKNIDIPEVEKALPRRLIKSISKTDNTYYLINGSRIQFLSAENPDRLRGIGPDFVWIDEGREITGYAWNVIYTRVTRGKKALVWVTTTPNGYDWVYEEIYKPFSSGNPNYFCVLYKSTDSPYFDNDTANEARQKLTAEFYRQEYEASFEYFTGRVFKDFDRKIHVVNVEIPATWERFRTIDFGYMNPTVCLFVARDPDGKLYVYDEYFESGKPTAYHVEQIKQKSVGHSVRTTYGDPSAAQMIEDYKSLGVYITPGNADVISGINRVTEYLKIYGLSGQPRIYINERCENTIREFENYRWAESKRDENKKDVPLKRDDHCMDALRYMIYTYTEPVRVTNDAYVNQYGTAYTPHY